MKIRTVSTTAQLDLFYCLLVFLFVYFFVFNNRTQEETADGRTVTTTATLVGDTLTKTQVEDYPEIENEDGDEDFPEDDDDEEDNHHEYDELFQQWQNLTATL